MGPSSKVARQVRQRKLNKTTPQYVFREDAFDPEEYISLLNVYQGGASGVEASEEKARYHLHSPCLPHRPGHLTCIISTC